MDPHPHLKTPLLLGGLALAITGLVLWLGAPGLDLLIFETLRVHDAGRFSAPIRFITDLGGFRTLGPVALAVVVVLLIRRRRTEAAWLFLTIASGRLAVELLKELIGRPRPPLGVRLDDVITFSFPSSHAAGSLLTWLALSALFADRLRWLPVFAVGFALSIGWTRMALGVHWPSDILAGYGLALIWVTVATRWLPGRRIE